MHDDKSCRTFSVHVFAGLASTSGRMPKSLVPLASWKHVPAAGQYFLKATSMNQKLTLKDRGTASTPLQIRLQRECQERGHHGWLLHLPSLLHFDHLPEAGRWSRAGRA